MGENKREAFKTLAKEVSFVFNAQAYFTAYA